jgi:hypothetical protein
VGKNIFKLIYSSESSLLAAESSSSSEDFFSFFLDFFAALASDFLLGLSPFLVEPFGRPRPRFAAGAELSSSLFDLSSFFRF